MKNIVRSHSFGIFGMLFLLVISAGLISVSLIRAQTLRQFSEIKLKNRSGEELQTYLPLISYNDCFIGFFDEFNDPLSGWPIVNNSTVQLAYKDWEVHPLNLEWQGYGGVSMDTDLYDKLHISYHDVDNQELIYMFLDNYGWHREVVTTTEGGYFVSLKTDPLGYPHIAYTSYTNVNPGNLNLLHAYKNSTGWHTETVDTNHATGVSLDIDANGYGHIAYFDNNDLRYAYQDSQGWHTQAIDTSGIDGEYPSLALDDIGYPHISYYSASSGSLKYAHQDSEGWHIEIVDQGTPEQLIFSGYNTALALDTNNFPHIAYVVYNDNTTHSVLMYAYFSDNTWKKELAYDDIFDNTAILGVSLTLDQNNGPHISFGHSLNTYYLSKETGFWQTEALDSGALETQLVLDTNNKLHLVYKDQFFNALKYAKKNGEYQVFVKSLGPVVVKTGILVNNFRLTVNVRNGANMPGSYGLVFGLADDFSQFYTFEIYSDSRYEIWKYNAITVPSWTLLSQGTSFAILPGIEINNLEVVRDGSLIEVYVNSELLTSLNDESYLGLRDIGLIVTEGNLDIRFDKFSVCMKDGNASSQPQNQFINKESIDWIALER